MDALQGDDEAKLVADEGTSGEQQGEEHVQRDAATTVVDDDRGDDSTMRSAMQAEATFLAEQCKCAERYARHPAALTTLERLEILDVLCSDAFCDQPPAQVFHALLDQGVYLCSIRTMIRILADHRLTGDRRRGGHGHAGRFGIPVVHASKPNQAWSWGVAPTRGMATSLVGVGWLGSLAYSSRSLLGTGTPGWNDGACGCSESR